MRIQNLPATRAVTTPSAAPSAQPAAKSPDTVVLNSSTTSDSASVSNGHRKWVRLANSGAIQLGLGDSPGLVAMGMQSGLFSLSPGAQTFLDGVNVANVGLNVIGTAIDIKQMRDVFKNPNATALDRKVEVAHLILGDLLPTATSVMPLLMPMTNPIVNSLFLVSQAIGIGVDAAKFGYDLHRGGQQS